MTLYLSFDQVLHIHYELVDMFADQGDPITPSGPRDENLLHSAITRPQTSIGDTEKYETVESKAAALFHSLVMNHAFHNGNKRTAFVATLVFLDSNNRRIDAADDEFFDFVVDVASRRGAYSGSSDDVVEKVEKWIDSHTSVGHDEPKDMLVTNFLDNCQSAGAIYRRSGDVNNWIVRGPNKKSIKIGSGTKKLAGGVVRNYLQRLGLSTVAIGVHMDEFQAGLKPEQTLIRRYRNVLKRLAFV